MRQTTSGDGNSLGDEIRPNRSSNRKSSRTRSKDSPSDFPMPTAMQLAQLAAILAPKDEPKFALELAMKFYFEAVLTLDECPNDFDTLFLHLASADRLLASAAKQLNNFLKVDRDDVLLLEPNKPDDDARRFLTEEAKRVGYLDKKDILFGTPEAVLENLRACYESQPVAPLTAGYHRTTDKFIEDLKCQQKGVDVYRIPRFWLVRVVEYKRAQASEARIRGWVTRRSSGKPQAKKPSKKINKNLQRK